MRYEKEVSKDGRKWVKVTLISIVPIGAKTRYVITVRNLVLLGFQHLSDAKKQRRKLRKQMNKFGVVMDLAGYAMQLYLIRDVKKPDWEKNAIDVQYEVVK